MLHLLLHLHHLERVRRLLDSLGLPRLGLSLGGSRLRAAAWLLVQAVVVGVLRGLERIDANNIAHQVWLCDGAQLLVQLSIVVIIVLS